MNLQQTVSTILTERVIAIIRLPRAERATELVAAIHAGGVCCIEITLNTPGALRVIAEVRDRIPEVVIGAGTVCSEEDARSALTAGARFLVTPAMLPELIPIAHEHDAPVVMGAFTPTEMFTATRAGADLIKLFPASDAGPEYLKAVLAPFPHLRVVPTGGIGAENAAEWLAHGAVALGVGGALTDLSLVGAGRFDEITAHARHLLEAAERIPARAPTTSGSHA
jgi:2-dehydro-3-deoxyphosphogluconate aldolase / (4S)-4-hydroxy-2-oxoglutarate aldolase